MTRRKVMLVAGGLGIVAASAALGCGGFGMPREHFDGVNRYGYATWWASVGTLDLGDGVQLPLVAGFQSDREWSSPVLGKGWILALTDSSLVALDERTFRWIMPDGQLGHFYRDKTTPTLLDGGKGWKGEIQDAKGETVTLSASCGTRYVYRKGKLASMTTSKNRTLQWLRAADGALREIREGGRTHLKVEIAPAKDVDRALVFGGQRLEIAWGERPRVGVAGADRAVTRIALAASSSPSASSSPVSLSSFHVTLPLAFAYGFDAKHRPTLTVTREGEPPRELAWDPQTRRIATDGEWTYAITPGEDLTSYAAIGRKNAQGQSEFWHRDHARGREIETGTNGVTRTTTWFVYGKLAGKIRKIEETVNGKTRGVRQCTYDEQARLIRETEWKGAVPERTIYQYDAAGNQVAAVRNGQDLWRKTFNAKGQLTRAEFFGDHVSLYTPLPDGGWQERRMPVRKPAAGASTPALREGGGNLQESKAEVLTYARDGWCLSRRDSRGDVRSYERDPRGRVGRILLNGVLYRTVEYDSQNREVRAVVYTKDGKTPEREERTEYASGGREARHRLVDLVHGKEIVIVNRYDEYGRVVEHTVPGSGSYRYAYDAAGNRTQEYLAASAESSDGLH